MYTSFTTSLTKEYEANHLVIKLPERVSDSRGLRQRKYRAPDAVAQQRRSEEAVQLLGATENDQRTR